MKLLTLKPLEPILEMASIVNIILLNVYLLTCRLQCFSFMWSNNKKTLRECFLCVWKCLCINPLMSGPMG